MRIGNKCSGGRGIVLLVATLSLLVPGCVPWWDLFESEFPQKTQKAIDAKVAEFMEHNGVPGVIVGVWSPSEGTFLKGFGVANRYTNRPITPNDKVRIGSITKSFTATVLLQLMDEGLVSLDDTVDRYIAGVPNGDRITLRQLGNMTSGLPEYTTCHAFTQNINKIWTPAELIAMASAEAPQFEPGTDWKYCNTNYILLGMIIEQVTGSTLPEEIQKRIIGPLDMKDTFFATAPEIPEPFAHGYCTLFDGVELQDMTFWKIYTNAWAAGANVSTASDLRTWIKAIASGKLLSPAAHQEQITWVDTGDSKYGLGVFQSGRLFGHNGSIPGYNSAMFYLSEQDTVVIVLTTCSSMPYEDASYLTARIADIVFPE